MSRAIIPIFAASFVLAIMTGSALPQELEPLPPFDISERGDDSGFLPLIDPERLDAAAHLQFLMPDTTISWNRLTLVPDRIVARTGFLNLGGAIEGPIERAVFTYLQESKLFLLDADDLATLKQTRIVQVGNGLLPTTAYLAFEQRWRGLQVLPASMTATVGADGRLTCVCGILVPDLDRARTPTKPALTAATALAIAAAGLGTSYSEAANLDGETGRERSQHFAGETSFANDVPARLVYFLAGRSDELPDIRLAWEFIAQPADSPFSYQIIIDAMSGELLYRASITAMYAEFMAYFREDPVFGPVPRWSPLSIGGQRAGTPGIPVDRILVPAAGDWFPLGPQPEPLQTIGNNATVFVAWNGDDTADPNEMPEGITVEERGATTTRFAPDIDFAAAPEINAMAAATNLFAVVNWWHDRMRGLGFDEVAGNYQVNNASGHGVGGDPLHLIIHPETGFPTFTQALDGSCCAKVDLYYFSGQPQRDSSLDATIVLHELTHALTTRLAGGPTVYAMKIGGVGVGEGYSDIYPLLLLADSGHTTCGPNLTGSGDLCDISNVIGAYATGYYLGLRRFPYSDSMCINPLTADNVDDKAVFPPSFCRTSSTSNPQEIHKDRNHHLGELLAVTFWDIRQLLVAASTLEEGNELMLQLLTYSLLCLGAEPTLLDARDALILADRNVTAGANVCRIWEAFARRGLGYNASVKRAKYSADYSVPNIC